MTSTLCKSNCLAAALCLSVTSAVAQDGFEAIKPEIARIAAEQVRIAADESVRYLDRPIETDGNCRRIDLRAYQQEYTYFRSNFEIGIFACEQAWAVTYWNLWRALEHALNQPEPIVYEMAVGLQLDLAGAEYPDENVVTLAIANELITNHKAGMSQAETTMQAFMQCVDYTNEFANWSSETYPPIPPVRREENRGQIVCGE